MDQSVSAARKHVVSSTQQQVMEELRYLHLAPEEEYVDHSTGYSIDALVQLQGRNARTAASTAAGGPSQILKCIDNKVLLAVEVDGPSHFGLFPSSSTSPIRNDLRNVGNYQVLGGTAMKKRHLVFVGYTVMSVPYWEWDAMNSFNVFEQRATRLRYLKHQLHSHGLLCEKVDNVQKVVNS